MPWEQLERLDGCFQSVEIFVAILRKSPNLIRCDNIFFRTGSGGSGARAHLPNLRSLRVSFTSMDELQQLLNLLDLPSLLHLYIYFVGANGQLLADAATLFEQSLCQFLDRSACRLQTFVAGHGFLDGNYVVQALSQQVFEAPAGDTGSFGTQYQRTDAGETERQPHNSPPHRARGAQHAQRVAEHPARHRPHAAPPAQRQPAHAAAARARAPRVARELAQVEQRPERRRAQRDAPPGSA
ncbi:hypothetical protein FIBSPDRAFT_1054344 [Athelia psychrophila]|uniref:FBD domain-containing protein n=1 Tax=Athelia psychrophila TaxID=1759441 RepID=A0A167VGP7_9AGAM|nr:hypothetical protein FIBSPDRAFT_1054344 [Fibularhizoctonia sp. CBS 109695]